jgi:FHS family L-fucose permease-like MFS transporter
LAAPAQLAGSLVSVYWGLAMVGRFAGAGVMRRANPARILMLCACGAFIFTAISSLTSGVLAAAAILGVGLFNSIMFPTIFALAVAGLGERTAQASGIMCLAIVGGAIMPLMTGAAADHVGLKLALFVPAMCYVWIALYARLAADEPARSGKRAGSYA